MEKEKNTADIILEIQIYREIYGIVLEREYVRNRFGEGKYLGLFLREKTYWIIFVRKNSWEHFGEGKYFGIILVRENIWDHFSEGKYIGSFL